MSAAACATRRWKRTASLPAPFFPWCRICAEQYRVLYRAAGLSNHTGRTVLAVLIAGLMQASGR